MTMVNCISCVLRQVSNVNDNLYRLEQSTCCSFSQQPSLCIRRRPSSTRYGYFSLVFSSRHTDWQRSGSSRPLLTRLAASHVVMSLLGRCVPEQISMIRRGPLASDNAMLPHGPVRGRAAWHSPTQAFCSSSSQVFAVAQTEIATQWCSRLRCRSNLGLRSNAEYSESWFVWLLHPSPSNSTTLVKHVSLLRFRPTSLFR